MRRDQIERLKHNTRLDVRMPDQLKDEFLARCRQEGVSSGAVIRSLILDYVTKRPSPWLTRYKEMIVRRSRWIAGGASACITAGLAAFGIVFAPVASADDYTVALDVELRETGEHEIRSNRMASTVQIAIGERLRVDVPPGSNRTEARFAVDMVAMPCPLDLEICPDQGLAFDIEIIWLETGEVISSPRITVETGQLATLDIGQNSRTQISVKLSAEPTEG